MRSITIHNMDELLAETIDRRARENGESLNATIKELLARALGLPPDSGDEASTMKRGYRRFLGKWTAEDEIEFAGATRDFERIDEEDWR